MLRLGKRFDAYFLYLFMGGVSSFASSMIFTVLAVYYVQTVGMNPLQLVLVGTLLEGTILIFEVPTGIVADAYSRRLSVLIGLALVGVCYVVQGLTPFFAAILAAEFVRGVGETFMSGATEAWIADEVGEAAVGRAYLRHSQVSRIGSFAGILAGTGLGAIHLTLPVMLGGGLLLALGGFLALTMPETRFQRTEHEQTSHWQTLRTIARDGLQVARSRPVVLLLVLVAIVFGAFSEGFDRLGEAHFLRTLGFPVWPAWPPVVWIGLLNAGGMLIGIGVVETLLRRLNPDGNGQVDGRRLNALLLTITAGLIVAVIAFGLAPTFAVGVVTSWAAGVLRSLQYPLATTWLNQHLPPRVRATVLSLVGQADALGQVAGGPVVGLVGLRSLRAALVFAGLILSPALLLYGRELKSPTVEQPAQADAA